MDKDIIVGLSDGRFIYFDSEVFSRKKLSKKKAENGVIAEVCPCCPPNFPI